MRRLALAGLALVSVMTAGAAIAQSARAPAPAKGDELVGDWLLETSVFEGDCKINGMITFKRSALPNSYTCNFVSEQVCTGRGGLGSEYIRVRQTCTAQKVGKQVAIKSQVARVEEFRPPQPQCMDRPDACYYADNFIVTLQQNLSEMLGQHYDEARQLKARFWRDKALIS
jgi:hypothetical protein